MVSQFRNYWVWYWVWVVELMLVWLVITIDANQTDDINVEFVFCYNLVSLARVNW